MIVSYIHIYVYSPKVKDHVYVENYFCRVFSCWWSTRGSIGTLTQFPLDQTHPFLKGFLLSWSSLFVILAISNKPLILEHEHLYILKLSQGELIFQWCRKLGSKLRRTQQWPQEPSWSYGFGQWRSHQGKSLPLDSKKIALKLEKRGKNRENRKNQEEKAKIGKALSLHPSCQIVLATLLVLEKFIM